MFRNTAIFQFNCFKATIYKRLHRKLSNTAMPPYYHVENFLVNKVYVFFKKGLFKVSSLHIFHCLSHMWNGYDWLLRMLASQKPNHFQLKWQRYDNYIINHSCLFLGGSVIGLYSAWNKSRQKFCKLQVYLGVICGCLECYRHVNNSKFEAVTMQWMPK